MSDLYGPPFSSSSLSSSRTDRHDRRDDGYHIRRRSVPPGDLGGSTITPSLSRTSSSTSTSSPVGTRNRRRNNPDLNPDPEWPTDHHRTKIEQVFFPPFEEEEERGSGSTGRIDQHFDGCMDKKMKSSKDEIEGGGWARLLGPSIEAGVTSKRPSRSMLNHRRTQSSTDISPLGSTTTTTTTTTPIRSPLSLRPSGFSLNQMDPPVSIRARTTLPIIHTHVNDPSASANPNPNTNNVSISPLTRSARRMLNVDQEMSGGSPIEACAGGEGLVEVIKLDRLGKGRRAEGSMVEEFAQEDLRVSKVRCGEIARGGRVVVVVLERHADMSISFRNAQPLRRSATLPSGRNKRKALSADLTVSNNRRYPTVVPPRALTHLPEITIIEPTKVRNRPPPLRNLPPPSWSSPGPSPPLTSLATPFSTDMFVMPWPNPVASMTPGLLSPNYTPPHSPGRTHHHHQQQQQSRSVPVTPRSDPMEELCDDDDPRPIPPPRIRRRSSLASLESSTETIRPWHMIQLTPKPSRAQLSSSLLDASVVVSDVSTGMTNVRQDRGPLLKRADDRLNSTPVGLELETLVCDWDYESDDDRGRAVLSERKHRVMRGPKRTAVGGRRGASREQRSRSDVW